MTAPRMIKSKHMQFFRSAIVQYKGKPVVSGAIVITQEPFSFCSKLDHHDHSKCDHDHGHDHHHHDHKEGQETEYKKEVFRAVI